MQSCSIQRSVCQAGGCSCSARISCYRRWLNGIHSILLWYCLWSAHTHTHTHWHTCHTRRALHPLPKKLAFSFLPFFFNTSSDARKKKEKHEIDLTIRQTDWVFLHILGAEEALFHIIYQIYMGRDDYRVHILSKPAEDSLLLFDDLIYNVWQNRAYNVRIKQDIPHYPVSQPQIPTAIHFGHFPGACHRIACSFIL
jgi:hypothetical protein